jgi:hypothetical protein
MIPAPHTRLIVMIPVFNDWTAVDLMLQDLSRVLDAHDIGAELLIVDDGSTMPLPDTLFTAAQRRDRRLDVLHLKRNVGHQRAIAIGLAFVHDTRPCDAVVVMDGDGEDQPSDLPALLKKLRAESDAKIIFAARTKRSEHPGFRMLFFLYRALHRMLTGFAVRVGNFSVIPFRSLATLVVVSDMWNHYAAAVVKAAVPHDVVPTTRGRRLAGTPTMNFAALASHGLSALSIFGDVIAIRVMVATGVLAAAAAIAAGTVIAAHAANHIAIAAWFVPLATVAAIVVAQTIGLSVVFLLLFLSARSAMPFIPLRDYRHFVDRVTPVAPR